MKYIGGFFCDEPLSQMPNHFLEQLCPPEGSLTYTMSGRCAIYAALKEIQLTDQKRVAYVPLYTCETVLAPFQKAGYTLLFYPVDKEMRPIFDPDVLDQISVISICGYYGFCNYDREFVKSCHERGIVVIEDVTHSIFSSDGIDDSCDYVAGSLRKWIGVPSGGFLIKKRGAYSIPLNEPDSVHLKLRKEAMEIKRKDKDLTEPAMEKFWDAEMMLRQMFDSFQGDEESIHIMNHFLADHLIERRRDNYRYLLEHLKPHPSFSLVFPTLPSETTPSHLTLYADDREFLQAYLKENEIGSTIYWPVSPLVSLDRYPDTAYVYSHVISLPCDQRYDREDMQRICNCLENFPQRG